MGRLKSGVIFWVLLIISVALPAAAQKGTIKKQLFYANIATASGAGVGTGTMVFSQSNPAYMVRTYNAPGQIVTKVALTRNDGTWGGDIVLCDNNDPGADLCTYDGSGNLDIEGVVVGPMFPSGVTGGMFVQTLLGELLQIKLNDGSVGTGLFVRIM